MGDSYQAQKITLNAECDGRPAEDILIHRPEHVSRIEQSRLGIQHVVRHEHLVPGLYPVVLEIVCGLHTAVHAEETKQVTIDGVMECGSIQRFLALVSNEDVLLRSSDVRHIHSLLDVIQILIRLATAT